MVRLRSEVRSGTDLVGQERVDLVWDGVDGHEEIELTLDGLHSGDVDVKEAERVDLELAFEGLLPSISGSRLVPWR